MNNSANRRRGKAPSRTEAEARPFACLWPNYLKSGFPSLPANGKIVLVSGYSGRRGKDADEVTLARWARRYADANIAIRLPRGVVGLDVDAYHSGDETLSELSAELGPLPETWRSTSRAPEDPVSGIYLFRVPDDTTLNGSAGPGIDVIQRHHRYVLAPCSRHPDTGRVYGWWVDLDPYVRMPTPLALPVLPEPWLTALTLSSASKDSLPASLDAARAWYAERAYGAPCEFMAERTTDAVAELTEAAEYGGLHDALSRVTFRLCRWAAEGHPGLDDCLADALSVVLGATRERGRDLRGEWRRALGGAAALVCADDVGDDDPCVELEGLK